MSVPHGNSVLALGRFDPATTKMPQILNTPATTPSPIGPFEQAAARVSAYTADYWLMSKDGGKNYDYLAYNQTITLDAMAPRLTHFPHVTTNVLTRQF